MDYVYAIDVQTIEAKSDALKPELVLIFISFFFYF